MEFTYVNGLYTPNSKLTCDVKLWLRLDFMLHTNTHHTHAHTLAVKVLKRIVR
jgi:hypothetical protein